MSLLQKPIKLSICISSLEARMPKLTRLISLLSTQARFAECELVIIVDSGQMPTGAKRNRALDAAGGEYVCCIDDDDEVSPFYIRKILEAIDANPGVDAILIRGRCDDGTGVDVEFDYRIGGVEGEWETAPSGNRCVWRSPAHLCPIRTAIARQVRFPQPARGEDLAWGVGIRPLLSTAARAGNPGEILYYYHLDPKKVTPRAMHIHRTHEQIFTPQYTERSGPGSTALYGAPYTKWLTKYIRELDPKTIIDLGCGDMQLMMSDYGLVEELSRRNYIGYDCIKPRVERNRELLPSWEFRHADLRNASLDDVDLVLCKDVIQHWSNAEIVEWLGKLRTARFKHALITNCNYGPTVNQNISTGGWRAIDLTKAPFAIGQIVFQWGDSKGGYKDTVLIRGQLA